VLATEMLVWRDILPVLVNGVVFLHNGVNGPVSKTTHMFRALRQLAAPRAKSVVSDCIARWAKYIYMFVCLSVYLSIHVSRKPHKTKFYEIFCTYFSE